MGCFACQSICLVISFHSGMSRAVQPQEFSKVAVNHWHIPVWVSHSAFCSKLTESVRMMACMVQLSPLEAIQQKARVTASTSSQAGGWARIGCIAFRDGSCTLFDSEAPPWLVFGDWAISVHYEILCLLFSWIRSLISDPVLPFWPFSTVLSQVFWQKCLTEMPESVWVPFLLLALVCLSSVSWHTCNTESSAWPIQDVPYTRIQKEIKKPLEPPKAVYVIL